jgi:serine/threonine protein kinase
MAPEVLTSKKYDSKVDLWSVGIILYELIAGYRPYKASSLEELTKIVVSKPLEYPKGIFSPSLVTLISGLLQVNPKEVCEIFSKTIFTEIQH